MSYSCYLLVDVFIVDICVDEGFLRSTILERSILLDLVLFLCNNLMLCAPFCPPLLTIDSNIRSYLQSSSQILHDINRITLYEGHYILLIINLRWVNV